MDKLTINGQEVTGCVWDDHYLFDAKLKATHKRCACCDEMLPIGQYWKGRGNPYGLSSYCKRCNKLTRVGRSGRRSVSEVRKRLGVKPKRNYQETPETPDPGIVAEADEWAFGKEIINGRS